MVDTLIKDEYDVVIVGAGPGGSMCAKKCVELGLDTLVVERRQEIGVPVRCGEGLAKHWMGRTGLEYDPSWCVFEINGAVLIPPNGNKFVIPTAQKGYTIDRRVFDKKLALMAAEAGAHFLVKSRVYDVIKEGNFVKGVRVETPDKKLDIKSKIVIAADGVDSKTAKYAGINTNCNPYEVDSGYEYEITNINADHPEMIHLYFGLDVAPRGYVWIFPKTKTIANVGIGIDGNQTETAKYYLDKFIKDNPDIFKDSKIVEVKGGCIPVGHFMEKPYADGLMIIGDAARMVNAIHGGGIGIAMESGIIAAETAKEAIDANDVSGNKLSKFYDIWYERRGKVLLGVLKVRKFFEKLNDEDMNALRELISPEDLLEFSSGKKFSTFIKLVAKKPKLALTAAKTLR